MAKKLYVQDDDRAAGRVLTTLVEIALVAVLGLFLAKYVFFSIDTESKSMEPGIRQNSVVFINKLSYIFREPGRFDVVAFTRRGSAQATTILVRRIVGLPGETVRIEKGTVYIDGEPLDVSPWISEITSDGIASEDIHLGPDEYFVLGNTPANSEDSRSSTIGAVTRSRILGKAWLDAISLTEFYRIR
ncbi:MAG: signal peptidase I [Lachnospiraceae bacterium]|nr:signal peptidase I [Lachnospiraceae bacterium]MBP5254884.1 signal peptidase I [Lachnospiraceae bacterium]